MWKNYLTTALRLLRRDPLYAAINIGGLAIGFAVALLSVMVIWQETHFDDRVPALDRLFLVETRIAQPGEDPLLLPSAPGPVAPALLEASPDIETAARLLLQWSTISDGDRLNFNTVVAGVDPDFPELFPLDMIAGDISDLADPASVFLSQSMAERIYGSTSVVGHSLEIDIDEFRDPRRVAGVFADWPQASHLDLDIIVPINSELIR